MRQAALLVQEVNSIGDAVDSVHDLLTVEVVNETGDRPDEFGD